MSIKICVITPVSHLNIYGAMGEMDMALSHLILENGGDNPYTRYYKMQSESGRFITQDNSAFELEEQGKGLNPDLVLDAAELIKPSEVIATDVLFDGEATIQSTRAFIDRIKERDLLGKYQIMAVPQGKSIDEWFACFETLLSMPEVDTIGLSKLAIPMSWLGEKESAGNCARSRLMCCDHLHGYLKRRGDWPAIYGYQGKPFHLLGGDNWTAWEMQEHIKRGHDFIRSNDSSCAVWYGRHRHTFSQEGKIQDIILDKPDLENDNPTTEKVLSTIEVRAAIMENVALWHRACK